MDGRVKLVLALMALVVALIVGLAALIETDAEAIRRVTNDCRRAFLDGDVEEILVHLASEAEYVERGRKEPLASSVRERVKQERRRIKGISLRLRDDIEVDGDVAHATWQGFVRMRPRERIPAGRFVVRVEYRRESDAWKVRRVELSTP
ncbi:MAG: nuclear transport factor 2 family protein [Planctomycetota bacterium]